MADNRLELPCGEPLVEVCLLHEFRYPVHFFTWSDVQGKCQCSGSLSQASVNLFKPLISRVAVSIFTVPL